MNKLNPPPTNFIFKKLAHVIFIFTFAITVASCAKTKPVAPEPETPVSLDAQSSSNSQNSYSSVIYYKNNVNVSQSDIDFTDTTLNTIINNEGNGVVGVYAYTTVSEYLKKGTALGHNLTKALQIENDLRNYANSIGAITLYDQTGNVDPSYTDFEQNYIGNTPELQEPTAAGILPGTWHDNFSATQPSTIYPSVSAFMWFSAWQNKVSAYSPRYIYGVDMLYEKTIFRRRLATLTNWGWQKIVFNVYPFSFLNNNSKSWLSAGL